MNLTSFHLRHRAMLMMAAICGICLFTGCHFNAVTRNLDTHRADAEQIVGRFYDIQRSGEYRLLDSLYTETFMKANPLQARRDYMLRLNNKLGEMKDLNLTGWQSQVTSGTDAGARYMLVYQVTRSKFLSTETFELMREHDSIRILTYTVESDGMKIPDAPVAPALTTGSVR